MVFDSVADPGCLSRIPDPGSDFFPSRIPDPGSQIRTVSIPDPGSSSKNLSILTPKKALKNKIRVVHPGSRIRMLTFSHPGSRIPDPGVKKAPNPGSRIRIRNTGFWFIYKTLMFLVCVILWSENQRRNFAIKPRKLNIYILNEILLNRSAKMPYLSFSFI